MNILIPMAGLGDRFKRGGYTKPKPLIDINGKPMIQLAIESLGVIGNFIFVINKNIECVDELKTLLYEITINPTIIEVDYITDGPASTCLLAKEYINNGEQLIIANCDQIMEWDPNQFTSFIMNNNVDGIVVTYNIITEKNSYVKLDENGFATEFAEKKIISDKSLNGIHYWKYGSDFISAAESMIKKNIKVNNEFYIAPTYNEMIQNNKRIRAYNIGVHEHWAVGTPDDLEKYLKHATI